jgi:hypothetical protein
VAKLAFFTFGILHESQGHPRVQEFIDRVPDVFRVARETPGFVAHWTRHPSIEFYKLPWGDRVDPGFFDEARHPSNSVAATLSIWEDIASVQAFAYSGKHLEALQKRKEWFRPPEWPTYVMWWIGDDETPTWEEACDRLAHLHDNGATAHAFNFKQAFDCYGAALAVERTTSG